MRALRYDPDVPGRLALGEVPDPDPGPDRVLVQVAAVSLNFADVAFPEIEVPGAVPGFDAAGTVVAPAADGTGPVAGTPVATFDWSGGWAELRAVDPADLAPVPAGIDLGAASAVPAAGVTALQAVRRLGRCWAGGCWSPGPAGASAGSPPSWRPSAAPGSWPSATRTGPPGSTRRTGSRSWPTWPTSGARWPAPSTPWAAATCWAASST